MPNLNGIVLSRGRESNMPATKTSEPPKKKKTGGRKPGYRRLGEDVLTGRRETLQKKLQVLVARRTLIEDRLQAYEQEAAARAQEQGSA
jgi:hypothetical protein